MQPRHQHPDRITVLPTRGGRQKRTHVYSGSFTVGSTQFPSAQYLIVDKVAAVGDMFELRAKAKFATNITHGIHGNRAMLWRAELKLTLRGHAVSVLSESPSFLYQSRDPRKQKAKRVCKTQVAETPVIQEIISDAR